MGNKFSMSIGDVFGKLTAQEFAGNDGKVNRWRCKCACGKETAPSEYSLRYGTSKSCGCTKAETKGRVQIGNVYNNLTVVGDAGIIAGNHQWDCVCVCGNTKRVQGVHLKSGQVKSCGCLRKNCGKKHGGFGTKEYQCWADMKRRCYNTKSQAYVNYGGRGITVYDEWDKSFPAFLEAVGPCPQGMTLDRINNDGNYEPGNVRWASGQTQARNRRSTKLVTYKGETKPLATWCDDLGLKYGLVLDRIHRHNWGVAEAFEREPLQACKGC